MADLNSLLRKSSIEDHAEALKLANAAVKASKPGSPDHTTAQHAKVVALLKLDRFDDALRTLAEAGTEVETLCLLEKAYALYKTGALAEAETVLRQAPSGTSSERRIRHIAAQVAYRAEKFEEAAAIYRELIGQDEGRYREDNDLKINLLAANAQLEWQGQGHAVPESQKKPGREDMEAFETAYNAACGCVARGDFARGSVLLKRAKDLCEASEDLTEEEKRTELVPIIVQQAYVLTKTGKSKEAVDLQNSIALSDLSDVSTRVVALSNSILLKHESNPFMTQRLLQALPTPPGSDRLFDFQTALLRRNKYTVELEAQKFSGVKKTTSNIILNDSASSISADKACLGVLNAAAQSKLHTGKEALHSILPLLDARPHDVGLLLTIIHLYVQTKNPAPALSLLEAFFKRLETAATPDHADIRFAPGLVALAVALYRLQGRPKAVRAELARASAHWQQKEETDGAVGSLLRSAGVELLQSSDPADLAAAGASFERLVTTDGSDRVARAGLVASFATTDYAKVKPHLASLASVEKLTTGINIAALVAGGVATLPTAPSSSAPQGGKKRAVPESARADKEQPAQKKRRRMRLPKNYVEGEKPDPERWLPLRDRSTYRPKRKKGKKRAPEAATQGGIVKEETETLELVGGAGAVKVEKAPAGGIGGPGGGTGGKKKKKGKK